MNTSYTTGKNCIIDETASIGKNVVLGHNCIIESNVQIGDNTYIDSNTIVRSGTQSGKIRLSVQIALLANTSWTSV